jgi:hypothetical protein
MEASHTARSLSAKSLSGTHLKRIACISMLVDHIGASCLEGGRLADIGGFDAAFTGSLSPAVRNLVFLDIVLRLIGRVAFPIYCFLLVEGFLHTRNATRYALRLFAFALISEVPFDLAFFKSTFYISAQNVFFTLFLGMCCMILLQPVEGPSFKNWALRVLAIATCGALAQMLHTDYGFFGVVLIAVLYLLRKDSSRRTLAGCILTSWEITAPLAFLLLHFYNGERGKCPRWEQFAFYAFYPAHLSVLAAVTLLALHAG